MNTKQIKAGQWVVYQLKATRDFTVGDAGDPNSDLAGTVQFLAVSDVPFYSGGELKAGDPVLVRAIYRHHAETTTCGYFVDSASRAYRFEKSGILGYGKPAPEAPEAKARPPVDATVDEIAEAAGASIADIKRHQKQDAQTAAAEREARIADLAKDLLLAWCSTPQPPGTDYSYTVAMAFKLAEAFIDEVDGRAAATAGKP